MAVMIEHSGAEVAHPGGQQEEAEDEGCDVGGRHSEPDAAQSEEVRQGQQEDDDAEQVARELHQGRGAAIGDGCEEARDEEVEAAEQERE